MIAAGNCARSSPFVPQNSAPVLSSGSNDSSLSGGSRRASKSKVGNEALSAGQAFPRRARFRGERRGLRLRRRGGGSQRTNRARHLRVEAELHARSRSSGGGSIHGLRRGLGRRPRVSARTRTRVRPPGQAALSNARRRAAQRVQLRQGGGLGRAGCHGGRDLMQSAALGSSKSTSGAGEIRRPAGARDGLS